MLDSTLIQFVEPIGPGQIVDRESLVALPVGYLKVAITNSASQINVCILGIRGVNAAYSEEETFTDSQVRAYVWQNGQVVAGKEIEDIETKATPNSFSRRSSKKSSILRRRHTAFNFIFEKDPQSSQQDDSMVDAILQLCLYKTTKSGRGKSFSGSVHVALKYLTDNEALNTNEIMNRTEDWYKVFQKSAFLPGNPAEIAKTNCYISGRNNVQNEDVVARDKSVEKSDETNSITSTILHSKSAVSFSQFELRRKRSSRLVRYFSSITQSNPDKIEEEAENFNKSLLKRSVSKWLSRLNRSKETPIVRYHRTSETDANPLPPVKPLVIIGPNNNVAQTNEKFPFQAITKRSDYSSSSNNSSVDVGYESSHCDWSDDDVIRAAELSKLANKTTEKFNKKRTQSKSLRIGTSSAARPVKISLLGRSVRIPRTPSFTSFREITEST